MTPPKVTPPFSFLKLHNVLFLIYLILLIQQQLTNKQQQINNLPTYIQWALISADVGVESITIAWIRYNREYNTTRKYVGFVSRMPHKIVLRSCNQKRDKYMTLVLGSMYFFK